MQTVHAWRGRAARSFEEAAHAEGLAWCIKSGDRDALVEFEDLTRRRVLGAVGAVKDPCEAQDTLRDAYSRLWDTKDDWQPQDALQTLLAIVKELRTVQRQRKAQRRVRMTREEIAKLSLRERLQRLGLWPKDALPIMVPLDEVIGRLSPKLREVVQARLDGLAGQELAERLNTTMANAYQRLTLAKKALHSMANVHGALPVQSDLLRPADVARALGYPAHPRSIDVFYVALRADVRWHVARPGVGGYHREDWPKLWRESKRRR